MLANTAHSLVGLFGAGAFIAPTLGILSLSLHFRDFILSFYKPPVLTVYTFCVIAVVLLIRRQELVYKKSAKSEILEASSVDELMKRLSRGIGST